MKLREFLLTKMRMSHIYQPLFISTLLKNNGVVHRSTIAKAMLNYDNSQIEYYEKVVDNMVGRILRKHEIVYRDKDTKEYSLPNFGSLSIKEIEELINICENKIEAFLNKRGESVFAHRSKNRKAVSGSIRYKVLKRAKFRCELCGISADDKALEVDHIVPKNHGGEDSVNNYQALCYTCNANKRDTDDEDFRDLKSVYDHRDDDCIFCSNVTPRIVLENNLAFTIYDMYPVTHLHSLIIPKRHDVNYFSLYQPEINAVNELMFAMKQKIEDEDNNVKGFNIGMNNGEQAGQTIFHTHIHLIPRRDSDTINAIGGVRNIIHRKGMY